MKKIESLRKNVFLVKIMANDDPLHICKRALINEASQSKGDNLLTECINLKQEDKDIIKRQ